MPGVSNWRQAALEWRFIAGFEWGDSVAEGDVVIILEAMKMETEIRAHQAGTVSAVKVKEGDSVSVGDVLITL